MIGNRLKQRRIQLGLTQQQVADIIGAKKNTISNYECDVSSPSEDIILRLMDALKCDANYLYGDFIKTDEKILLDKNEMQIIKAYRSFNDEGKEKVLDMVTDMSQLDHYKKRDNNEVGKKEA